MSVGAVVPVQEALHIHHIAGLQSADSGVDLGLRTGQVSLHAEVVACAVVAEGDIDIVAGLAVLVLDCLDGQTLEGDELILMVDQLFGAQQLGDILSGSDPVALQDLKGSVHDLQLAGPLSLVAGDLDLGALGQLGSVLFGAGHLIHKVCAVGILSVNGDLVVPPGLVALHEALNGNRGIQIGSGVLGIGHGAFSLLQGIKCGSLGFGSLGFGSLGLGSLGLGDLGLGDLGLSCAAAHKGHSHSQDQKHCEELSHFNFSFS